MSRWLSTFFASLLFALIVGIGGPRSANAEVGRPVGWAMESARESAQLGKVTLVYEPELESLAQSMLREVPQMWSELEQALGRDLDDELTIRFVEHAGQVARVTKMPKWVAGVAHSSTGDIMLARIGPDGSPTHLDGLLRHELAHVALYRATDGAKVPRWFNEGVADSLADEIDFSATEHLAGAVFGRGIPPLDQIDNTFREERLDVALAYAASRDFVTFLRFRDPTRRDFGDLVFHLRQGFSFEAAVLAAYDIGLYELDAEWRSGLLGRFAWFPMLSAEGMPVLLLVPLVGLAWWRRRQVLRRSWARLEAEDALERSYRLGSHDWVVASAKM